MSTHDPYIATMTSPDVMTADELARLNLPDNRTELVRGRLQVREPAEIGALDGEALLPGFALPLARLLYGLQ